ncbi:MAG TPA: glycoside hydrolase family 2 TIM barrel-domain containing protein [Actinomycetota bacterium]|nr:glycoside hydrolase family 2 TIM barrel-domain containing protein [Actinomycetota bacterium]
MSPTRPRRSLDGDWDFWPDLHGALPDDPRDGSFVTRAERDDAAGRARVARVPGVWQAQFDDLRGFAGAAWYERTLEVPSSWDGRAVHLCFGAVDYHCTAWVDGRLAGMHEGGYLPFRLDVTDAVAPGRAQRVTLRVLDPGPGRDLPSLPFAEIPHGKQSWYGPLGGPWQSVHVEAVASPFVAHALVVADPDSGDVDVRARLGAPAVAGTTIEYVVASPDGLDVVASGPHDVAPGTRDHRARVRVARPERWDVDAPRLYSLAVVVRGPGGDDEWRDEFGFRTVETRDGRVVLNGRPLYVRGALDQDYYAHTIASPASDDDVRATVLRARELGLNLLRCHIKVADPRYARWCDRLGMLVWAELPNWQTLTPAAAERARTTLRGMIERDFNRPSIVAWTVVNEGWGVDLPGDASHRAWVRDTYRWTKDLDPTRIVVDNSPCAPNFHVESDLNDFHFYRPIPDGARAWSRWTAAWVADPASTYSPHGDAVRRGDEPMIVSEFGNWGLPDVAGLVDDDGREPWWFDTGADWEDGIVLPRGVRARFDEWRLDDVFGSWREFVAQSQEHELDALRYEIDDMRAHRAIAGYVVTELTDVHWECNGLLDQARNPKTLHARFASFNCDDAVIARPAATRVRAGESVRVEVVASHWSQRPFDAPVVEWTAPALGARGRVGGPPVAVGGVAPFGDVVVAVPPDAPPGRVVAHFDLLDDRGRTAASNELEIAVFDARPTAAAAPFGRRRGDGRDVVVAPRWDDDVEDALARGERAVIVATGAGALPDCGLAVEARAGSRWEGHWAQGMGWLRPALRAGLPLRPRVDLTFLDLVPEHVVAGYEPEAAGDVLAGLYVGWIHATAATVGTFSCGDGAGIVCTFPVAESYGRDPLATALLDRLVDLAAAPGFAPVTRIAPAG